ncbi:MAG TPA: sigma-70 family RNA polymerase sigma factor [Flavobacteriales bacterium]|nr:sigma-70 family RNA polymerase sigma factor [Flavobacteriales bacterium]
MDPEQARFLGLVHEHRRIVYRIAGLYTGHPDDRKDLEQEMLLQAWQGWSRFRGEAKFSTWLYRIALNTALTWNRRPAIVRTTTEGELPDTGSDEPIRANDERERLQTAMRRLPSADRALLVLHLDGFDHAEAGVMLGLTANHVAVKLHRIKARLTELLNPH